jgi:hypothetical protein
VDFNFAEAIAERPESDLKSVAQRYGEFSYHPDARQFGAIVPDWEYETKNIVRCTWSEIKGFPLYPFPSGLGTIRGGFRIHKLIKPILIATFDELHRRGLSGILRTFNGCYMPRHVLFRPNLPLSIHCWAAIDLDAAWNGYGQKPLMNPLVVRTFEECGWTWGGRWAIPDGMHFQYTRPIPRTEIPPWQDALAHSKPHKVIVNGHHITDRFEIPTQIVVNATNPERVDIRINAWKKITPSKTTKHNPAVYVNGVRIDGQKLSGSGVKVNAEREGRTYVNVSPDN